MKVTLRAPAKLTLSLRIIGQAENGYHLIDAEMVSLDLYDVIELDPQGDGLQIVGGGTDVPTDGSNLINKALALAGRTAGVQLHKNIPSQAGLGGGSSDAAAILRWAGLTDLAAAAEIGADVPFCTVGGRARVSGIGEVVEPLSFKPLTLTVITPPVACATPAVYRAWDALGGPSDGDNPNDLEPAALAVAPELARYRDEFANATGQRPILAGSGSSWFVYGSYPGAGHRVLNTVPPETVPPETVPPETVPPETPPSDRQR